MDKVDFNGLSRDEMQVIVDRHCHQLIEHFDAVQILVSLPDEGGTGSIYSGRGNWYARQGMAQDFVKQDQARTAAHEISKVIGSDEE